MTEWTEAEKSKLIALYNKNIDVISIAKQLNKKLYQVVFQLEKLDLIDQSKNQDDEIINQEFESEITDDNYDEENKINGIDLKVQCLDCKKQVIYNANDISEIIHSPASMHYLGRLFGRLICNSCNSPRLVFKQKDDGAIVLDVRNIRFCNICGDAITVPRLRAMPKSTSCTLCASPQFLNNILSDRLESSIKNCPICNDKTYVALLPEDGSKIVYCIKYTSKSDKQKDPDFCSWSDAFIDKDDHDELSKKFYSKIRAIRLNHAKKRNVSPFRLLTDNEIRLISQMRPHNESDMSKINFNNYQFVESIKDEIFSLFVTH